MAELNEYNQISQLDDQGEKTSQTGLEALGKSEKNENAFEKTLREQQQRVFVQTMASGAFVDDDLKGMLDYAEKCSAEDFKKMLSGDASKGAPPLSEIVMKEKLWQMGMNEEEKKYPGLKEKMRMKLAVEKGAHIPTDRRILMAESVWELKYEAMDKIMPANLQADFKRYYGEYNRNKAGKHGITRAENIIPDCDAISARMEKGVIQRIVLEYTMLANEHFPPETVKLWTDHIKQAKSAESAIQEFNELIGKGEHKVGYIEAEEKFNMRRSDLMKKNPAAHDFFLRLYNKETQEKLYASRDKVMDQAIAHVDQAMKELGALTTDKELLDITKYETIDAILAKKKELKGESETIIDPNAATQMDEASLKKLIDGAREEAIVSDTEIQQMLLERRIVEAKKVEMRVRHGKSDKQLSDERMSQINLIKDTSARNKAEQSEVAIQAKNEDQEVFTDTDARKQLFVIGDKGIGVKEKEDQQRLAKALDGISDDELANKGLPIGAVLDQKGQEILDDGGLQAKQNILDTRIDAALSQHIQKKAIGAGLDKGKAAEASHRSTRRDRLKDTKIAIDNMMQ